MKYRYEAKNRSGEVQAGSVEAGSRDSAISILASHDLFILSLESADRVRWYQRVGDYLGRVGSKDLMIFTRQLSTLLEAHIPLEDAMGTLYTQTAHPAFREAIKQISQDISAGLSFSQALEHQKEIFSYFYVNLVHSAEITGNLEEAVGFLADYLEKEYILTSKARSALVYPAVVIGLFAVVAGIMVTVVFPQIGPVFEQAGVELPWFSRALLSGGAFLGEWWFLFALVGVIFVLLGINYNRTPEGKAFVDEIKVRLPLTSRVYVPLIITRLSNVMALLLKGGIPVTQAVEVASLTVSNAVYKECLTVVADDVRQGKPLSTAILRFPEYFPPLVSQMLIVGEKTGQIDKMFGRLSTFYGREVDSLVGNLVELIQPALMIIIGVFVGLLFSSILIPIYQLTSTIQ